MTTTRRAIVAAAGALPFAHHLGVVDGQARLEVMQAGTTLLDVPVDQLQACYEAALPRRLQQAPPPPER